MERNIPMVPGVGWCMPGMGWFVQGSLWRPRRLRMLLAGGNAVDAAIATAICLTVVEPNCNGLGSDAFALVWAGGRLYGLNGSGYALGAPDPGKVLAAGHREMPQRGWIPVTIPGAVSAWAELHRRFGNCPLPDCSNRPSSMPGRGIRCLPPFGNCGRPGRSFSRPSRGILRFRAGSTLF